MMTLTYTSPRTGQDVTVSGTEMDDRYPDSYVQIDTDRGVLRIPLTAIRSTSKPRCYMEYCCNTATHEIVLANRGIRADLDPIHWGWCPQHAHLSSNPA